MQEAKLSYEEAIRLAKDNPYLHHEYGKMLYTFQRYFEALEEYDKALSLKEDFTQVYLDLSEVYTALAGWAQEEYKRRKMKMGSINN
jgi:tetratricopeptide (TPR) repeat protein